VNKEQMSQSKLNRKRKWKLIYPLF